MNSLEAGGLVEKVERGKYRITGKAVFMLWEPIDYSEEEQEEDVKADIERRKAIQEDLGMTEEEYQEAVMEEYERLREERISNWLAFDLFDEAARNVERRQLD